MEMEEGEKGHSRAKGNSMYKGKGDVKSHGSLQLSKFCLYGNRLLVFLSSGGATALDEGLGYQF